MIGPEEMPVSWRDPSGWRPYPLQMSVPWDEKGIPLKVWERLHQVVYDPVHLATWITMHTK